MKLKKRVYVVLFFILVFVLYGVKNITDEPPKKTKVKEVTLNNAVLKTVSYKKEKLPYEGLWVKPDEWEGGYTFKVIDAGKGKVRVEFSDNSYGYGVGRAASFKTEPFTVFEEIKDQLHYGRFKWDSDNGGWGYMYANHTSLYLILEETRPGGGAINRINRGMYEFHRPYKPEIESSLHFIQDHVKMSPNGYMPEDTVTYSYLSRDGSITTNLVFDAKKHTYRYIRNVYNPIKYSTDRKGVHIEYNVWNKKKKKNESKEGFDLKFPLKKGLKWENDKTKYEVVDMDYPLLKGLKNVVVVKETSYGYSNFYYYHRDFGLLGWGEKSKNKYGHEPVELLNSVEFKKN